MTSSTQNRAPINEHPSGGAGQGRLAGKRILVTAAAMGIGRSCVEMMVAQGAYVVATDIKYDALMEAFADNPNIECHTLDVRDESAINELIGQMPAFDVLFNCAGYVHQGTIFNTSESDWDFSFDINVKGQFRMIQAVLPSMVERGHGSIINMASVCSSQKGFPNRLAYGASKAAVIGLTKAVAADVIKMGVRVNCICPGTVESPSLHDRINSFSDPVQARKDFIARQPMGRLGEAHEIAPIVIFLASDESSYATGQAFVIDGGILL
jgi:2-keto-3-deoxy-L-fuconate dehydrogenase